MNRDEALEILRRERPRLSEAYGITALAIFGSTARNEAGPGSDVDVYVDVKQPNLFELGGLFLDLKELLGTEIDLVHEHSRLPQSFRRRFEQEGIFV